jgi:hypothetical protein
MIIGIVPGNRLLWSFPIVAFQIEVLWVELLASNVDGYRQSVDPQ